MNLSCCRQGQGLSTEANTGGKEEHVFVEFEQGMLVAEGSHPLKPRNGTIDLLKISQVGLNEGDIIG